MSMKVLIAGGGIAGLTLAQGLRREGIDCELFEREPLETWRTGYLLNLDAEGDGGLAACLPEPLYELFTRACGETMARHDVAVVVSPHGDELSSMPHVGAPATGERPPTNIDRRTFRAILLSGLDGIVRHGVDVADVDVAPDAVKVRFADGHTAEGDVLVAADGVGSAVRRAVMPDVAIIPAPVGALGLFGRSPLTDDVVADLPQSIWDAGFAIVSDGRGTMLGYRSLAAPADRVRRRRRARRRRHLRGHRAVRDAQRGDPARRRGPAARRSGRRRPRGRCTTRWSPR